MKRRLLQALRGLRLLGLADGIHYLAHRAGSHAANGRFVRRHAGFDVPPARLAFEAYGHTSWREYQQTGLAHARAIAALVREHGPAEVSRVAEWGCGCARILRHLAQAGLTTAEVHGFDVDAAAIAWCRAHIAGGVFHESGRLPPLPVPDGSFDVIYHYSVWTHLSADSIEAWARELARVLRPGGLLIATTHGDHYRRMLLAAERARFDAGEPVARGRYREGRKYYLSFHPAIWVERLLAQHFVRAQRAAPHSDLPQEVWIAVK